MTAAAADIALIGGRVFTGDETLEDHAALIAGDRIVDVVPAASVSKDVKRHDLAGGLRIQCHSREKAQPLSRTRLFSR